MAQRRMFNKLVTNNDKFLEMPLTAQALYFHLAMNADDDGFVDNWKMIMKMLGSSEDDMKLLIMKAYVILFESGLIVITHWRLNNYLRSDRFTPTIHKEEMELLTLDDNNVYQMDTTGIPNGNPDKIRLDKNRIDNNIECIDSNRDIGEEKDSTKKKNKYGFYKHVLLTHTEYEKLQQEYPNYEELITYLDEYIEMKGYKAKSHYLCIKKWVIEAVNERKTKKAKEIDWRNL